MNNLVTDGQVFEWLIENVYRKGQGEFRIHTNRQGVRLYLSFSNSFLFGLTNGWYHFSEDDWKTQWYHREANVKWEKEYSGTVSAPTLLEALREHQKNFPENKEHNLFEEELQTEYQEGVVKKEFSGTLEEFVDAYNAAQVRQRRNDYHNISVETFTNKSN